ncbi:toll-like receptor m [Plakobranchus ocellatus]|uniref:Toll-like receptor m n=1 Tax=Plakobranchus ocellatus TaxID=259542 RepID=A0AAV4CNM5_9GAST|nr:toll-like receptor m [Plakobranchus ocellatus]
MAPKMAPTMPKKRSKARSKNSQKIEVSDEDRQPGVVYIGHIPHGFYERQLNDYFSQFGTVLELKLSRSKKTGNSKGYAFVKFQYAAVAKTVAETCHNYLFFNKLLKCEYKPLSDIHPDTFFRYHMKPNMKPKRKHNRERSEKSIMSSYQGMVGRHTRKMDKLRALGLNIELDDIVEINNSSLPTKTTDQSSGQKNPAKTSATPGSQPRIKRSSLSAKTTDQSLLQEKSAKTSASPDSQAKVKASSKRKREAVDADSSSKVKIGPKAKRARQSTNTRSQTSRLVILSIVCPQGDSRLSSPLSGQDAGSRASNHDRRVRADLSASLLSTNAPTDEHLVSSGKISESNKYTSHESRAIHFSIFMYEKLIEGLTDWLKAGKSLEAIEATKDRKKWRTMIANAVKQGT